MSGRIGRELRAQVAADVAGGASASWEDLLVAALVALPFAACLGIFINIATRWPTPVPLVLTLMALVPLTLWIAGFRRRHPET